MTAAWLKTHGEGETSLRAVLDRHFGEIAENVRERLEAGQSPADAFDPSDWVAPLKQAVRPRLLALARKAAQEAQGDVPATEEAHDATDAVLIATEGMLATQAADEAVEAHLSHPWWDELHQGIADDIAAAVAACPVEGEGKSLIGNVVRDLKKLAGFVWDWLRGANEQRAERIATSETTAALNAGGQAAASVSTRQMKKRWVAVHDDRTRDAHAAADGQVVDIAEPFMVGGEQAMYPADPALSPGNRINCRCHARYFTA